MFERFTDRARRVMHLANEEAVRLRHGVIGTEHVLLGLLKEGHGVAIQVLESFGIKLDEARTKVEALLEKGTEEPAGGKPPLTPRAKTVLTAALDEAKRLSHNYVGTEHLLLGLLRDTEGIAGQVLQEFGATLERSREEVKKLLGTVEGKRREDPDAGSKPHALIRLFASASQESKPLGELASLVIRLSKDKKDAVAAQNYEKAAQVRDKLNALNADLAKVAEKWGKAPDSEAAKSEG
jgi:ATP-dependent Clp protease ATP-binding subunit ClpC